MLVYERHIRHRGRADLLDPESLVDMTAHHELRFQIEDAFRDKLISDVFSPHEVEDVAAVIDGRRPMKRPNVVAARNVLRQNAKSEVWFEERPHLQVGNPRLPKD